MIKESTAGYTLEANSMTVSKCLLQSSALPYILSSDLGKGNCRKNSMKDGEPLYSFWIRCVLPMASMCTTFPFTILPLFDFISSILTEAKSKSLRLTIRSK